MSVKIQRRKIARSWGVQPGRRGKIIKVGGSIKNSATGGYYVQFADKSYDSFKAVGNFEHAPGVPVVVRYDPSQQQEVITGQDFTASGDNTTLFSGNALDPASQRPQSVLSLADLRVYIYGTSSLSVSIGKLAGLYYWQGAYYPFAGKNIDLSGSRPVSANQHCYAVLGYYPPLVKVDVMTSTAKSTGVELTAADINEAWSQRARQLVPIAAIRIENGQTGLTPSDVKDLRQFLNTDTERGSNNGFLPLVLDNTFIVSENQQTAAYELTIGDGTLIIDGLVNIL